MGKPTESCTAVLTSRNVHVLSKSRMATVSPLSNCTSTLSRLGDKWERLARSFRLNAGTAGPASLLDESGVYLHITIERHLSQSWANYLLPTLTLICPQLC